MIVTFLEGSIMQDGFIEPLEDRRLMSATVSHATASHETSSAAKFALITNSLRIHPAYLGLFKQSVSEGQVLNEPAQFLIRYLDNTNPTVKIKEATAHPDSKGAVVPTTFRLHIISPLASFSSFPTVYQFTLNTKTPLTLFSIKKKDSKGDVLKFTGTLSANLKTITGVLDIKGPNRSLSDTYSVSYSK